MSCVTSVTALILWNKLPSSPFLLDFVDMCITCGSLALALRDNNLGASGRCAGRPFGSLGLGASRKVEARLLAVVRAMQLAAAASTQPAMACF
mmetsp:Transcript_23276/g.46724  ORF Transcript_23276/g.46724 Transcript_23276/m.46724 type:complete len:93 (+) Transcript_23276:423-701(+)